MTNKKSDLEITINNLKLLRAAWENNEFEPNMADYGGIVDEWIVELDVGLTNECGTDCCIIGYAPSVIGLEIKEEDFLFDEFSYDRYSNRLFPYLEKVYADWLFLFGSSHPNSKEAFFKRLDIFLNNNS